MFLLEMRWLVNIACGVTSDISAYSSIFRYSTMKSGLVAVETYLRIRMRNSTGHWKNGKDCWISARLALLLGRAAGQVSSEDIGNDYHHCF